MTNDADNEHLRLLSIAHYVVGGLGLVCASFPLIHLTLGLVMISKPEFMRGPGGEGPPAALGWVIAVVGGVAVLLGWTLGLCTIVSGRFIHQRKHRTFSLVVAAIQCLFIPFGTTLGVFTLIVLVRQSVRGLYELKSG
ncbi:MAG: hypothetical protein HYR88_05175 [Verrucomicrobia bacterium]|nr:hypothetical protein [Verrucomicrobiota bacterium]MBI3869090.1 hypothetical protein [Verrucomicrobiota bacterium]